MFDGLSYVTLVVCTVAVFSAFLFFAELIRLEWKATREDWEDCNGRTH